MPRPNKEWERKYGKKQPTSLLSGDDNIISASEKLAAGVDEAQAIILQALRHDNTPYMRLLDMDELRMHGNRIVKAYHEWSKNDYTKLMAAVKDRDASLIKFINSIVIA